MSDGAESFSDFEYASARIQALRKNWQREFSESKRRHDIRYHNVSIQELRATGRIAPDAVWITRRIADSNIRREMAPYVAYIEQSRDAAKFTPRGELPMPVEPLEQEFTQFVKYDSWNIPFFEVIDGALTHGWDAIEVIFDVDCPGHFRNYNPGREHLLFQMDVSDIQQSDLVPVGYSVTTSELRRWVEDYEFDKAAAEEVILWAKAQENKVDSRILLFKVYSKIDDGPVQVAWWCEHAQSGFLKKPEPLFMGRMSKEELLYEDDYPIYILRYTISENKVITESKGRVFLDEHDQEACTQLATAFVNRAVRSSYILVSSKTADPNATEGSEKQTSIKLRDGAQFNNPVDFFNIEPPDAAILNGMQMLITQNAAEVGQVNFAVNNRKDSRKTATEIQTANQQSTMLNSVQVTLLSSFLKNVFARNFSILQSRVLNGKVKSRIDRSYYQSDYDLLPAGDVEVVRRAEMTQKRMQDWPVMQTTAAAKEFLMDFIRERYGSQSSKYLQAIQQGDQKDNLIVGLGNAIQHVVRDPASLKDPKIIKALTELYAEYQTVMTPPGQKGQEQPPQQGEQPPGNPAAGQ